MKDPPFRELLFDLEVAPSRGFFFDYKKEFNIIEVEEQGFIFSVAWKWRGEDTIYCKALSDFPNYRRDKHNDYALVKFLHELLGQADVAIGHNGDQFDLKWCNSRFIFHRLSPLPPRLTRDTLKISRRLTKQLSHRLDALAQYYGIGRKLAHTGTHLWLGCYRGDMKSWPIMKRYNKHDVYLMDELLKVLDPWDGKAINRNLYTRRNDACPRCGGNHIIKQGYKYLKNGFRQRWQCLGCGGYIQDATIEPLGKVKLTPA